MYSNNQTTAGTQQNQQQGFPGGWGRSCGGRGWGRKFGGQVPWMKHFGNMLSNRIPVNIEEGDDAYYLHLYAAGLVKESIQLSVKNDVLSVSYKAPEQSTDSSKFSHREYEAGSFERLFQLNDKVLTDSISAAYSDGILKVTLPKNPETNKPAQTVTVS